MYFLVEEFLLLPNTGALRSFVTVFFNLIPLWISPKRALWSVGIALLLDLAPIPDLEGGGPDGGGGGGGGGIL